MTRAGEPRSGEPRSGEPRSAPPRPGHRLAWIVSALLSAVFVVVPATLQVWAYGSTESRTLLGGSDGRPVTALEIVAGDANVTVTPRSDQQVGYRAEVSWSLKAPTIEASWLGETLRLSPRCPGEGAVLTAGVGCSIQLGVAVPVGIPVKVTAGSGRVDISGLGGTVDVEVASGEVNLTGLRGALRADVGSGMLRATDLTSAQADIRVGSGRAVAAFITPPDRVTARAGSGRLALTVPPATRFRVRCVTGQGRCEAAEALNDPASPRRLDISADSGRAYAGYPDRTP
ncbi:MULTISPECIES: DUF4097 domain-containing protein [unclassified Streptomyces]|uniref:DUF4097 domain-containing protein n=1 Tax=unclassified Streptomyces TaxID=2593676 RepID=UPI001BE77E96|nr:MULTISPECIES: DUF4097 domain-containing protein [unclassified Streptomyces]MBT2406136.1 hypothetical protein [Streptomyces sp. ISL-21]MBT2609194.1 hypothetical protein [Streptomyces sp. ISL-87]